MNITLIESKNSPDILCSAIAMFERAKIMGLVSESEFNILDLDTLRNTLVKNIAKAGIAKTSIAHILNAANPGPKQLLSDIKVIMDALAESPVPDKEWVSVEKILGLELLTKLVNVSTSSFNRYKSGERKTPDNIAARLHFLALIIADLSGAYNEYGVRRWFERKREMLKGKAPIEILHNEWDPDSHGPEEVAKLARSITYSPAT